jgi:hypothetical protein
LAIPRATPVERFSAFVDANGDHKLGDAIGNSRRTSRNSFIDTPIPHISRHAPNTLGALIIQIRINRCH